METKRQIVERKILRGVVMSGSILLSLQNAGAEVKIDKNLPSGNIIVSSIKDDTVLLKNEMRDTEGWWFHWAFRVLGAAGRTLSFEFTNGEPISTRGPVISCDRGANWSYAEPGTWTTRSFTHVFPPDSSGDEVWFAMAMLYTQRDWEAFLARHQADAAFIETGVLCKSRKGRDVELARVGCIDREPKKRIWLSARHHACEMMASHVLEGILDGILADTEAGRWMRENVEFMVVPFVDKDGVEDGDQGKNRKPRDHNRDYDEPCVHPETRAIKKLIGTWAQGKMVIALDMHCPWVRGYCNEWFYQVYTEDADNAQAQERFGKILERVQRGSLNYRQANDLPRGKAWNTAKNYSAGLGFKGWSIEAVPGLHLSTTYEVPYATANGAVVTRESCREIGEDTVAAFKAFLDAMEADPSMIAP